jgi:hypothetical protein
MRSPLIFALLCTLLLASPVLGLAPSLQPQTLEEKMEELQARRALLKDSLLPAAEGIVASLRAQRAPVPPELLELLERRSPLETEQQILEVELLAERSFGPRSSWRENLPDLLQSSARDRATVLLIRLRAYLSSLILNATRIARLSPTGEAEIRAEAARLQQQIQNLEPSELGAIAADFEELLKTTFPGMIGPTTASGGVIEPASSFAAFREDISILLSDMTEALPAILGALQSEKLREEIATLQSHLQMISDSHTLISWLARFEKLAAQLLAFAVPTPFSILQEDISNLLENLESYLQELRSSQLPVEDALKNVEELRGEIPLLTDLTLDSYLERLEEILTHLSPPL